MPGARSGCWNGLAGVERERKLPCPIGKLEIAGLVGGRAGADLRRGLIDLHREDLGRLEVLLVRSPDLIGTAGDHVLDNRPQRTLLLGRIGDLPGRPQHHYRAVVEGVVARAPREHDLVDEGGRQAADRPVSQGPKRAAGRGAVQINGLSIPCVDRGGHVRMPVVHEPDVADERLVENGVDQFPVVAPPPRLPADAGPLGGCEGAPQERPVLWIGGHAPSQLSSSLRMTASESRIASPTVP